MTLSGTSWMDVKPHLYLSLLDSEPMFPVKRMTVNVFRSYPYHLDGEFV